jgi:hypothetical protein
MSNQCDKLDNLTKISFDSNISPALNQGIKFKDYQNKFSNPLDKKSISIKEGFETGASDKSDSNEISEANILATQSNEIVQENDFSYKQKQIENLRAQYHEKLVKYQELMARINGSANNYLDRVNNNPYLGKNIRFTTGHVCYVTQQGVVKHIPNPAIWDSIADKNKCPSKTYIDVNLPWLPEYDTPGMSITELNLITGTPMESGQSCGFAGKNVFVNSLVNNPKERYLGCYNDKPSSTDILFVPIMNSTNNVSGYKSYASSNYQNNNAWGPWSAFNRNSRTFWHSQVSGSTNYNGTTGVYIGNNKDAIKKVTLKNGLVAEIRGENLQINLPDFKTLTKYDIQGRQDCCNNPNARTPNSWYIIGWDGGKWVEVDKQENTYKSRDQKTGYELRTYYITNPKQYNSYMFITTNCGHPDDRSGNRYCVQISQWNLYTSSDYTFTDDKRAMTWNPAEIGYTDLETCKKYAVDNGWQYFGLQDAKADGTAACLVSNDLARSVIYGRGYKYSPVELWSTKTAGGTGNVGLLNNQGSLVVNNSSGAAVWASPGAQPSNYLGCYADCSLGRGLPEFRGWSTYESCQRMARDAKVKYFGLQFTQPNGQSECWTGNDVVRATSMGKANNCTTLNNIQVGGGCSNAIYNTNNDANSFIYSYLSLENNGNLCIYRGTSPSDNQGLIWQSQTNGKTKENNPNFTAAKSKFGKSWIPNGTTLAAGDWIGSDNGSIYLIMQSDGNLVLNTSQNTLACSTNSKGQQVGGGWVNALYELLPSPFKQNIGKIGYVDEENVLHEYTSNNISLTDTYTKFNKVDTYGNDIPGAAYGGANIDQCKSSCNNNKNCYGFVFDNTNKVCYPKTSAMWPYGGPLRPLTYTDTYIRGKAPIAPPIGVSKDVENIDSVQYQMYVTGGKLEGKYGLANATSAEQEELDKLQTEMASLSNQIASLTDEFGEGTSNAQNQSVDNTTGLQNYLQKDIAVQAEIDKMDPTKRSAQAPTEGFRLNNNIDKILQDSDIVVLQKNYDYLFWTILAAGSVVVAMNIKSSS